MFVPASKSACILALGGQTVVSRREPASPSLGCAEHSVRKGQMQQDARIAACAECGAGRGMCTYFASHLLAEKSRWTHLSSSSSPLARYSLIILPICVVRSVSGTGCVRER